MSDTCINKSEYAKIPLNKLTKEHIGMKVRTFGWVESTRKMGKAGTFIDLYAGYKVLKCLYPQVCNTLTKCTSVTIYGEVCENYKGSRDDSPIEFHIHLLEVFGNKPAPPFPINDESSAFTRLEYGHLNLRTKERILFLKARSMLSRIIRDFYFENDYTEVTPPTLVQTQVEGGSTLFELDYYGSPAYLTQSSQLYLETVAPVVMKTFCIMPSYRAEKSNTVRHLSEYTHVEAELADVDFSELLDEIEKLLVYIINKFYASMRDDILALYPQFEFLKVPEGKFMRIKYSEAIEELRKRGYKKEDGSDFEQGDDIPDAAERYLVKEVGGGYPVFLTHFPVSFKPFYMRKAEEDRSLTESVDLLFPGVGETVGGSMRCDTHDELMDGFAREGLDSKPYYWYTDMYAYGPCKHGGYGLGFERLLMGLMKWNSVNKATLYPRFTTRCSP
ncbi:putative asparagine--tRNA ligase, cytoplasmic [Astathelohania contejeani]|uniref:asparagine--tRNA ligase n=1 Tax=Astathelohania contejeani TaxID=164912 RepID=A0ABQ7I0R0_9MICR|nr:putative asparagine--tRNA ligase, cytoplasmic [Thelohania contejeani]